jgi:hypothetical protein
MYSRKSSSRSRAEFGGFTDSIEMASRTFSLLLTDLTLGTIVPAAADGADVESGFVGNKRMITSKRAHGKNS